MARRDSGWKHKHFAGDREAAKRNQAEANKLLGMVREQMSYRGLKQYAMTETLGDGTVIEASVVGGAPRTSINSPPVPASPDTPHVPEVFVVWARDTGHTAGIDATHPQQFLAPTWTTSFWNAAVAGYDDFTHNKKRIYQFLGSTPVFPQGARHAGNIDWVGDRKQRVSWYGPSTRHFLDPYVQPKRQFGKFVFHLGQALLDVDQYATDSDETFNERYVLGAAIRGTHLIAVMADLPDGVTDTSNVPEFTIRADNPWPVADVAVAFVRFAIAFDANPSPAMRVHIAAKSREVLWSGSIRNPYAPAFFNSQGTEAVLCALPDNIQVAYVDTADPPLVFGPSASAQIHRFIITSSSGPSGVGGNHLTTNIACAPGAEATVAADFVGMRRLQALIERRTIENSADTFVLAFKGVEWPLYWEKDLPAPHLGSQHVFARWLNHADLRRGLFVFLKVEFDIDLGDHATSNESALLEVWRNDALQQSIPVAFDDFAGCGFQFGDQFGGTDAYRSAMKHQNVAAAFPFYREHRAILNGGLLYRLAFDGAHGLWSYRPYPASEYFGSWGVNANHGSIAPTLVADTIDGEFDGHAADFDGYYSVLGCASDDHRTLLSMYGYQHGAGISLSAIVGKNVGSTLGDLTGVAGTKKRYHPIWLLGQPMDAALNQQE